MQYMCAGALHAVPVFLSFTVHVPFDYAIMAGASTDKKNEHGRFRALVEQKKEALQGIFAGYGVVCLECDTVETAERMIREAKNLDSDMLHLCSAFVDLDDAQNCLGDWFRGDMTLPEVKDGQILLLVSIKDKCSPYVIESVARQL